MMPHDVQDESDSAIQNWMNYKDNTEMAIKAIPEMVKLLNDEDHVIVGQAAALVHAMSKRKDACLALVDSSHDIVTSLVTCLMAHDATPDLAKNVVGTFYNLSLHSQGIKAILGANGIQPLINLLTVPLENIVSYAITTLHNILLAYSDVRTQIRKLGGVQKMVPLLAKHSNAKFLAIVVDCLVNLSFQVQETKNVIFEMNGPEMLVEILRNSNYPKLTHMTIRLMKVLSVCSNNKKALIGHGAMQALAMHLKSASSSELQNCLITLRNLSDAATRVNGLEELIENMIRLVSAPDASVSILAAGLLSNLTCNNENNKVAALRLNAIPVLIRVIENTMSKTEMVDACVCTLRHITNRHAEAAKAHEQIRANNGIPLAANLMSIQPRKWAVVKPTLGLVRNLAGSAMNLQHFKSCFMLEKLMHVLYDAFNEAQRGQMLVDDVKMIDMVEAAANNLLLLAKDFQNQVFLKDFNCIPFITQLFYSPVPGIQRVSASILVELVKNKDCAEVIEQQPGIQQVIAQYLNGYKNDATLANLTNSLMQGLQEARAAKMRQFAPPAPFGVEQSWNGQMQQQQAFAQQQQFNGVQNEFYGNEQQQQGFYGQQGAQQQPQDFQYQQQQPQMAYDGFTRL